MSAGIYFVSTFVVVIFMVATKTVYRQIAMQEQEVQTIIGIPAPKNLDSVVLNVILLLLVSSSMVLHMTYWNG